MAKIKYGLSDVHIALRHENDGVVTYDTPVRLPGAVNFSVERNTEKINFYADNVVYHSIAVKSSITGDLELADIANSILTKYLGYKEATEGGILETSDGTMPEFALLFKVQTDTDGRKFAFYNCTAAESNEEYKTMEENVDPTTSTLAITCAGDRVGEYNVFKHVVEASDANYANFFTAVTLPTIKTA